MRQEKGPSEASFTILGSTTLIGEAIPTTIFTTIFAFLAPFMVPTLVLVANIVLNLIQPSMAVLPCLMGQCQ